MISKKELALSFGLASSICMTAIIGIAVAYNTDRVVVTFPFGEQYIELLLGSISIILIAYELFLGGRE